MPELPEVEVTRRRIAPLLVGRTIRDVVTTKPSYFFLTAPHRLRQRLAGRRFTDLERLGKYLLASSDDGSRLLLHLGMTGQLFSSAAQSPRLVLAKKRGLLTPEAQLGFAPDEHTHLQLHFVDHGPSVVMRDVRKFGKVQLLAPGESSERLQKLGQDALTADPERFFAQSHKRRIPIKCVLLDQSVLAGVGNIYADEALHIAGVSPLATGSRLSRARSKLLVEAVRMVLNRAIEAGGSSISDFVSPDGADGAYQLERLVYGRTGEPCPRCSAPIERRVLAGRSTHYCRSCQR
jgi:formamidopyrimidine-DNA glycosylase